MPLKYIEINHKPDATLNAAFDVIPFYLYPPAAQKQKNASCKYVRKTVVDEISHRFDNVSLDESLQLIIWLANEQCPHGIVNAATLKSSDTNNTPNGPGIVQSIVQSAIEQLISLDVISKETTDLDSVFSPCLKSHGLAWGKNDDVILSTRIQENTTIKYEYKTFKKAYPSITDELFWKGVGFLISLVLKMNQTLPIKLSKQLFHGLLYNTIVKEPVYYDISCDPMYLTHYLDEHKKHLQTPISYLKSSAIYSSLPYVDSPSCRSKRDNPVSDDNSPAPIDQQTLCNVFAFALNTISIPYMNFLYSGFHLLKHDNDIKNPDVMQELLYRDPMKRQAILQFLNKVIFKNVEVTVDVNESKQKFISAVLNNITFDKDDFPTNEFFNQLLIFWSGSPHIMDDEKYSVQFSKTTKYNVSSSTCRLQLTVSSEIENLATDLALVIVTPGYNARGGKKNVYVSYNGHRHRVHRDKHGKYIAYKKKALYLKNIKGHYKTSS